MNEDALEAMAVKAAKHAVQETFLALGVDISTPAGVIRSQSNFAFLDRMREDWGKVKLYGMTTLVGIGVTALATVVWAHVK
jgi:hypothetical protein